MTATTPLIVTTITPDPEPEPTCFECGGEIHPETDQLFDEVLCEACHREAVSDHAYMFRESER